MLPSILITGASHQQRLQAAQKHAQTELVPSPDILILEAQPSIGIAAIRSLRKFLAQKAYQKSQKIALIPQADKLTLPAQNALLKTLEEPPPHSLIILLAPHDHFLLPTIVSRCQPFHLTTNLKLPAAEISQQQQLLQTITQAPKGERINLAAHHAGSKDDTLKLCQNQLLFLRQKMLQQPQTSTGQLVRKLTQTIKQLQANVNPKLCLESLFFSYPKA